MATYNLNDTKHGSANLPNVAILGIHDLRGINGPGGATEISPTTHNAKPCLRHEHLQDTEAVPRKTLDTLNVCL